MKEAFTELIRHANPVLLARESLEVNTAARRRIVSGHRIQPTGRLMKIRVSAMRVRLCANASDQIGGANPSVNRNIRPVLTYPEKADITRRFCVST